MATFTIGRQHLTYNAPGVVGYPYASQGQILTPMAPETSGARNGPGVAKTKRTHMMGVSFVNTAQGSTVIGTDFNTMHPANFRSPSGIPVTKGSLYSGTYWDTVENQTGFFSALAWKVTGPFPCAITNVTQFLHTQDR